MSEKKYKESGQVWIETVIYTLIGLTLIGITLAFAMPKINEIKERSLIEQSIQTLSEIDKKIESVIEQGSGNVRNFEVLIRKGEFVIDGRDRPIADESKIDYDRMSLRLTDLSEPYSEPGQPINNGRIVIMTTETRNGYETVLSLPYENIANVTYAKKDLREVFNQNSISYRFSVSNLGKYSSESRIVLNVELFS